MHLVRKRDKVCDGFERGGTVIRALSRALNRAKIVSEGMKKDKRFQGRQTRNGRMKHIKLMDEPGVT